MKNIRLTTFLQIALITTGVILIIILAKRNSDLAELIEYEKPLVLGSIAPAFESKDIHGNNIDFTNSISVLIFFNTSCGPCLKYLPGYQQLYEDFQAKDIQFIGITGDSAHDVNEFIDTLGLTFTIIHDGRRKIFWDYKVKIVPRVVVVDKEGRIVFYQSKDEKTENTIIEIRELLQGYRS